MSSTPELTVVIPTRNEAAAIVPNLRCLEAALLASAVAAELLVVDDSDDETALLVASTDWGLPLQLVHREPGGRPGGLAGAVSAGFGIARGRYFAVIDADLQHPPEVIPAMFELAECGTDVVVASRYLRGGSADGLRHVMRKLISQAARGGVKLVFPGRLAGISDPLSGFFLLHRDVLANVALRPDGFKILLEVLLRGNWSSVAELPYRFASRRAGVSKADPAQGRAFLRQLVTLSLDRLRGDLPPRRRSPAPPPTNWRADP